MRSRAARLAPVLVLAAFAEIAAAQDLIVQNLAPLPRREGCAVVVPFAQGQVKELPDLHVEGRPTCWQPFGARWPDGSLRQALCLFDAEVPALGEIALPLQKGAGPALPADAIPLFELPLEFVVKWSGKEHRALLPAVQVLEQNALRRVDLRRARLGESGLVAELIVTAFRGQLHFWIDAAVFFSDPNSPAMQLLVDELAIETQKSALILRHPGRLGVDQQIGKDGSRVVLLKKLVIGDGQGIRRTGVLVPPLLGDGSLADKTLQAAAVCPLLAATKWVGSGAFGAFGHVPDAPPWLQGSRMRSALAQRHRAFAAGDKGGAPFDAPPLGMAKSAGQTGDQNDFGTVKLQSVALTGIPSFLLEVEASVLQEACRPVHFREADGSPVQAKAHPQWVVWAGRTHWHGGVSSDRLGKPHPEPPFETHGWSGKDRQHWSSNYLGAFALLTGAHWARLELENEVQIYLAGQTTDPQFSTSHADAPRGAGRTAQAATWLWLATGSQDLLQRMNERIEKVYLPEWEGRALPPEQVRTFGADGPDPRLLQGKSQYWTPWQDAIAAVGFAAQYEVTRHPGARELAEELALNVVRHGWKLTPKECIVATAIAWRGGAPLSAAEIEASDPTIVLWSYGTAFSEWAIGAVEIAHTVAVARKDEALAQRAAEILQRVRAGRQPPRDGWYDRLTEWDAVRWRPE